MTKVVECMVQGAPVHKLSDDITGVPLNTSPKFLGYFNKMKATLNACAALPEYFLSPSAFGCNRAQLTVEKIMNGIPHFGIVDGRATSSNTNEITKNCEEASITEIDCGEPAWLSDDEGAVINKDIIINYLPSLSDLGGNRKEACSGTNFEMTLDTNTNDLVVKKLFMQLAESLMNNNW
eukprot:scaffold11393_cov49-Attheya_sp.AAC.1